MNRISTEREKEVFQARMVSGMYTSIDEFSERLVAHKGADLDELHKAFRNLARQLKVYQDGILEAHRELHHELYRGDDETFNTKEK